MHSASPAAGRPCPLLALVCASLAWGLALGWVCGSTAGRLYTPIAVAPPVLVHPGAAVRAARRRSHAVPRAQTFARAMPPRPPAGQAPVEVLLTSAARCARDVLCPLLLCPEASMSRLQCLCHVPPRNEPEPSTEGGVMGRQEPLIGLKAPCAKLQTSQFWNRQVHSSGSTPSRPEHHLPELGSRTHNCRGGLGGSIEPPAPPHTPRAGHCLGPGLNEPQPLDSRIVATVATEKSGGIFVGSQMVQSTPKVPMAGYNAPIVEDIKSMLTAKHRCLSRDWVS